MTNKNNSDSNDDVGKIITISDSKGNVKEELEVVNVRSGDEIQKGSFVIEVKEVKK